jgi:alkylhydroperoxidase/carboxymuconolactone decarboxylase family protein YurZ
MISNMQYPREMYGKGGLTSLKEARNLLEKYALPGESLAYINDEESKFLKYMGGAGIPVNSSGVPSYFKPKRIFKSITKPVAKVLDKIVPNEIKPALPFLAAAVPFVGPALSGTLAAMTPLQLAAVSAGANAFSQLSQEGAAERGLNPISLGLSALSGYTAGAGLQAPGTATAGNIAGNVGDMAVKTSDLASQGYSTIRGIDDLSQLGFAPSLSAGQGLSLTPPNLTQQLSNLGGSTTEFLGKVSRPGMESIDRIATDPFAAKGADYLSAAQTLAPGQVAAAGEVAYNAALDAQKAYQNELLAMGNLASANKQDQINYIRRAMVSAGFNEDEITSAITRSGFAGGGRVAYGMGSLVKPAMRGLKSMKNKIVDFISKMTDDIEIRTQTDYADDSGASFDIYITPKTERGKNTLDQINQMGLAEKISDGRYFINDINLEEATMSLNERGIKASGVYEPTAKGEQFESFRTAGQGPYGADYYGYDRLKEGLQGPKRPPMDQVDYDTIPSPTDKPEGFADGGLMNLRMGGMPAEMDLRKGGFVPLGVKEKADDVPARLSKNEFVFTAKAVRNAGGGDVRKGAKRMYQVMNQLEARA